MAISKAEQQRIRQQNLALLEELANKEGLSEEGRIVVSKIMLAESNGQTNAANPKSRARGLMQAIPETWNRYAAKYADINTVTPLNENTSADPRFDPRQSLLFGIRFTIDNERALTSALGGHPPTVDELYMAHFLGLGGGKEKGAIDAIKESKVNPGKRIIDFLPGKIFAPNSDVHIAYPNGDKLFFEKFTLEDLNDWTKIRTGQTDGLSLKRRSRIKDGIMDFLPEALGNMEMSTLTMIAAAVVALIGIVFSGSSSGSQSPGYTPPVGNGGNKRGLFS